MEKVDDDLRDMAAYPNALKGVQNQVKARMLGTRTNVLAISAKMVVLEAFGQVV